MSDTHVNGCSCKDDKNCFFVFFFAPLFPNGLLWLEWSCSSRPLNWSGLVYRKAKGSYKSSLIGKEVKNVLNWWWEYLCYQDCNDKYSRLVCTQSVKVLAIRLKALMGWSTQHNIICKIPDDNRYVLWWPLWSFHVSLECWLKITKFLSAVCSRIDVHKLKSCNDQWVCAVKISLICFLRFVPNGLDFQYVSFRIFFFYASSFE